MPRVTCTRCDRPAALGLHAHAIGTRRLDQRCPHSIIVPVVIGQSQLPFERDPAESTKQGSEQAYNPDARDPTEDARRRSDERSGDRARIPEHVVVTRAFENRSFSVHGSPSCKRSRRRSPNAASVVTSMPGDGASHVPRCSRVPRRPGYARSTASRSTPLFDIRHVHVVRRTHHADVERSARCALELPRAVWLPCVSRN